MAEPAIGQTPMVQKKIQAAVNVANNLIVNVKPLIDQLDGLFNGGNPTLLSQITQADLDSNATLSNMQVADLQNGMFALTSTVKTALVNAYTSLNALASRST